MCFASIRTTLRSICATSRLDEKHASAHGGDHGRTGSATGSASLPDIRFSPDGKLSRPFGSELNDRLSPPHDLLGQDILRLVFCSGSRQVKLELLQGGEDKLGGGDKHAAGNVDCGRLDGCGLLPRNFHLQNFADTGLRHHVRCAGPMGRKPFPRGFCPFFRAGLRRETTLPPGGVAGECHTDRTDGRVQLLWTVGTRFIVSNLSTHRADQSDVPLWRRESDLRSSTVYLGVTILGGAEARHISEALNSRT